jgi:hypothetical protein
MEEEEDYSVRLVREAVENIDVNERSQTLVLCLMLTNVTAQYVVDFLQRLPPGVINRLELDCGMDQEALEILRAYLGTTIVRELRVVDDEENGDVDMERLLSGLHGNGNVQSVKLQFLRLQNAALGGAILSDLLQHVPHLMHLDAHLFGLGPQGARAMQPGLRLANRTLDCLSLCDCKLGEGVSLLVDGLVEGGTVVKSIDLRDNRITSNGLSHITRLLLHQQQQQSSSLKHLILDRNCRLFDNDENTQLFCGALRNSGVKVLSLHFCHVPLCVLTSLFQEGTVTANSLNNNDNNTPTLQELRIWDHNRRQGKDLDDLLIVIPAITVPCLYINLDFENEAVVSAFHKNASILHLYTGFPGDRIPVLFASLKRNRLLCNLQPEEEEQEAPRRVPRPHSQSCKKSSLRGGRRLVLLVPENEQQEILLLLLQPSRVARLAATMRLPVVSLWSRTHRVVIRP